jgi:hypothetical protein
MSGEGSKQPKKANKFAFEAIEKTRENELSSSQRSYYDTSLEGATQTRREKEIFKAPHFTFSWPAGGVYYLI